MDRATELVTDVNGRFWYLIIALLVGLGLYFSFRTRFVQVRLLREMFRVITDKPGDLEDGKPGISAFRAFSISAASRVGTGNIAGVAIAISIGGPGAVFWMWVMAIVGGATSFVESTLGQLYKVPDKDSYRGGPAYYMQYGLGKRWMGVIFAVVITVTYGFVFVAVQSNSIADAVSTSVGTGGDSVNVIVGVVVALLTAAVIFGGVRRISSVSQVVVPIVAGAYLLLGLTVVLLNIDRVPEMLNVIVQNAFGLQEAVGGGIGVAIMQGIRRGLFSNEAGMGSAPNAGATASVSHPVKQGLVQSLGVYFDTLLVCTTTAFVILLADPDYGSASGASLTQIALAEHLGTWTIHFLTVAIFFLAFTSVIGNYYYGESNIGFLTPSTKALNGFRALVVLCAFGGAIGSLPLVWSIADLSMGVMATINLIAIAPLSVIAFRLMKHYTDQRRQGLDPVFHRGDMPDLVGVQAWTDTPSWPERRDGMAGLRHG
ncbi:alanine/glycine:cation symporter family protein [Rhodococcus tukisamuensis]|uniref:Alanine or glycine:cation symporter, AGCS family n=1 Tax=Rhodococcus tukisamuensis TaxID=168276 RepID=A0A1G7CXC7_9NOCA|nr:alanine/glycine:cation symporter family protein [Rhodococcus tukisamuensis]SDE43949.1 alanine or glycine:cation symporter, AGCS family [Rhodococcus tukisamuensis]